MYPRALWFIRVLVLCGFPSLLIAAQPSCPVTTRPNPPFVPPAPFRPILLNGAFWYGTDTLWTKLPASGTWRLDRRDGVYGNKLFLWRQGYDALKEPRPEITVVVKRLDADTPIVRSRGGTSAKLDGSWAMLTGIGFSTGGCWEITASNDGYSLTFVLLIKPSSERTE